MSRATTSVPHFDADRRNGGDPSSSSSPSLRHHGFEKRTTSLSSSSSSPSTIITDTTAANTVTTIHDRGSTYSRRQHPEQHQDHRHQHQSQRLRQRKGQSSQRAAAFDRDEAAEHESENDQAGPQLRSHQRRQQQQQQYQQQHRQRQPEEHHQYPQHLHLISSRAPGSSAGVSAIGSSASLSSTGGNSRVFSPPTSSIGLASTTSTSSYFRNYQRHQEQQPQHQHHHSHNNNRNGHLFRSPALSLLQSAARSILDDATPSTTATATPTGSPPSLQDGEYDNSEQHSIGTRESGGYQNHINSSFDSSSYLSTWRSPQAVATAASRTNSVAESSSSAQERIPSNRSTAGRGKSPTSGASEELTSHRDQGNSIHRTSPPSNQFQGPIYDSPYSLASSSYDEYDNATARSGQPHLHSDQPSCFGDDATTAANSLAGHSNVTNTTNATRHSANSHLNHSTASQLSSLQVEKMPALPDEQDRKRFLGCLAAILASSYDFDEPDDLDLKYLTADGTNSIDEQQIYLQMAEQSSYSLDEDDRDGNSASSSSKTTSTPSKSARRSATAGSNTPSLHHSASASFEYTDVDEINNFSGDEQQQQEDLHDTTAKVSVQTGSSTIVWKTSASKAKILLARNRHRRRRYKVLTAMLIQSSELLLLEANVSKGFIPMLAKVMVPESKKPSHGGASTSNRNTEKSQKNASKPPLWKNGKEGGANSAMTNQQTPKKVDDGASDDAETDLGSSFESISDMRDLPSEFAEDEVLRPFLDSLTPGAGIRCLSLFVLQHLLTSEVGYDARIRHVIKKLGVLVLARDMKHDPVENTIRPEGYYSKSNSGDGDNSNSNNPTTRPPAQADYDTLLIRATRKFESLERSIARRIIRLSESQANAAAKNKDDAADQDSGKKQGLTREQIVRGVKIGSAGILAGTLFAVTGGLAAGGIALGISALTGSTAAVAALTSPAIVTTIFGVGGGGLTAYKMQRRTQGLTEFEFRKESGTSADDDDDESSNGQKEGKDKKSRRKKSQVEAELFSVICLSGWLTDSYDYQRPWGLQPTNPKLTSKVELLERFYSIHSPEHVPKCAKILACWKDEEDKLWNVLRNKYGTDPDHLFPVDSGAQQQWGLTLEQEELLDDIFVELGYNSAAPKKEPDVEDAVNPLDRLRAGWKGRKKNRFGRGRKGKNDEDDDEKDVDADADHNDKYNANIERMKAMELDSMRGQDILDFDRTIQETGSNASNGWENISNADLSAAQLAEQKNKKSKLPKHLGTVWDFKSTYGGELYTVKWESKLLKTICDCMMDFAIDVVSGATKHLLKQTVLNGLLSAVAWPAYLVNAANMIDGDWTLAVERADEAGKELARTLLFSKAGRRPVTLVGFSFGGRIIYSCLKELARFQEDWEEFQDLKEQKSKGKLKDADAKRFKKMSAKSFDEIREPASIVEDVVLMGLPNHLNLVSWRACRQVVSGRLVNCYSSRDVILSLMFQMKRLSAGGFEHGSAILKPVCGTCAVKVPGVENFDVSDLVAGHEDYCTVTGKILERVRLGHPLRSSPTLPSAAAMAHAGNAELEDQSSSAAARKLEYS